MKKIAIQGIGGSFHHQVAEQYFGAHIQLVECMTFAEMPQLLLQQKVDYIVMAIENSLAGAILPNYSLISDNQLKIEGEVYIPIHHHLMGIKGQSIADIKEVWSHPMAILQCQKFFINHPSIKLVESSDTAAMAKKINDGQLSGIAAIASKKAAELYHLEVIEDKIQTRKHNYTRFFILSNSKEKSTDEIFINKASLKFVTKHKIGSLADVLKTFVQNNLNLTKIQSIPLIDDPWEYAFFADVVFEKYIDYQKTLDLMHHDGIEVSVLGEYRQSKKV